MTSALAFRKEKKIISLINGGYTGEIMERNLIAHRALHIDGKN